MHWCFHWFCNPILDIGWVVAITENSRVKISTGETLNETAKIDQNENKALLIKEIVK